MLHDYHPLSSRIEVFYHKDNSDYLKPDPRVFSQVLKHFSVKPKECAYVGDALSDAAAAKGAGMHFIAVLESGVHMEKDFTDYNVDFFAKKFVDITDYILKISPAFILLARRPVHQSLSVGGSFSKGGSDAEGLTQS